MKDEVKETLIKILISMRDMDVKTLQASLLIKGIPTKSIPLNIHDFFINDITERKSRIKKIEEFTLLLENQ